MSTRSSIPSEEYYYAAAPTTRLAMPARLDSAWLGAAAGLALIALGWWLRGLLGVVADNAGWAALVVFSIVGSTFLVNWENRR